MEFVPHRLMILAIKEQHPTWLHGHDFWVGHPCTRSGEQTGDAFIAQWPEMPPPDPAPYLARARELAPTLVEQQQREERNQLLVESDWAVMPDAPTDKAAWGTYRQALRDLPESEGWPVNVQWPVKPT